MDVPVAQEQRPSSRRLLLGIGAIVLLLCVAFGVTTVRSRSQYREYKAATLEAGPAPWELEPHTVAQCVEYSIDWAMKCPGVASWCANEAPLLTRQCLQSQPRDTYCSDQGESVASTQFGYAQCEQMREPVQGRYTKRAHKKHCAASFRAVAAFCRDPNPK